MIYLSVIIRYSKVRYSPDRGDEESDIIELAVPPIVTSQDNSNGAASAVTQSTRQGAAGSHMTSTHGAAGSHMTSTHGPSTRPIQPDVLQTDV